MEDRILLIEINLVDKYNIIASALFGSYNTEQRIKNKSYMDI